MEAINSALGFTLVCNTQPATLAEWNARYEAMSLEQDWWFKAGAAAWRWIHSSIASATTANAKPALRAARA